MNFAITKFGIPFSLNGIKTDKENNATRSTGSIQALATFR